MIENQHQDMLLKLINVQLVGQPRNSLQWHYQQQKPSIWELDLVFKKQFGSELLLWWNPLSSHLLHYH